MAQRGNRPLEKKESIITSDFLKCWCCGKSDAEEKYINEFYDTNNKKYEATGKIPFCKSCIEKFYQDYLKEYKKLEYKNADRRAVERVCMLTDTYYSDKVFDSAVKMVESEKCFTIIAGYFAKVKLYQYQKKTYDHTIEEKEKILNSEDLSAALHVHNNEENDENVEIVKKSMRLFGSGLSSEEDYIYLHNQYTDWITRHECNTKAQEEIFKQICFTQLELLKASRNGGDTKDLNQTFMKQLEAAKLQPKQNAGETVADNQTFGTLIDKYENTRPLPEIDEELRDVDKIGLYLDVFFRGHLAQTMGLKNGKSKLYTKFMKKYTVEKPEYNDDEDGEALFDAIFGNATLDD